MELTTEKKRHLLFYNYYFWIFTCTAIQNSFLSIYLSNAGMTDEFIGILNGIIQIIGLIINPIWGKAADKASSINIVLIFGLAASTFFLFLFNFVHSIPLLALVMILFSSFHNPLIGLYETITVSFSGIYNWNYGFIRMTGTISYAIMALIAGNLFSSNEKLIFPIFILAMFITTISAILLPKARKLPSKEVEKVNIFSLLKDARIRNVLILFSAYTLGSTLNSSYFGIYMLSLGGDYSLVGISQMILALSEIPFHVGPGARWFKKIGVVKSLIVMCVVGIFRWIIVGTCSNKYILMASMAFNGIMLVPTIVGLVQYIYDCAPDNMKASAQTGLKSTFQVGAQLLANFVGGYLVGVFNGMGLSGIKLVYLSLSPIYLIILLVVLISNKKNNIS